MPIYEYASEDDKADKPKPRINENEITVANSIFLSDEFPINNNFIIG